LVRLCIIILDKLTIFVNNNIMSRNKPDLQERQKQILAASRALFLRLGYDKTTFEDIAQSTGLSRASLYLCYPNKEALFTQLLLGEIQIYLNDLETTIRSDPDCDSVAAAFRAVIQVVARSPFLTALLKQDHAFLGRFLLKHPQMLGIDSTRLWEELLTQLQQEGLLRTNLDIPAFAHIMSATALGLMFSQPVSPSPDLADLLTAFAQILDLALPQPEHVHPGQVRAILLQVINSSQQQFTLAQQNSIKEA
jgi:AcrR family transcriptional regulator